MQAYNNELIIKSILLYNGMFALVCSASILFFWDHPLLAPFAKMHTSLLVESSDADNLTVQVFIAAWLVSNAIPRISAAIHFDETTRQLAMWSFYTEGYTVLFASFLGILWFQQSVIVAFLCMLMAKLTHPK